MVNQSKQACFQIEAGDNVCTALSDLLPGRVKVNGSPSITEVEISSQIKTGHKIANRDISEDEPIIKYGVVIGRATCPIKKGEWVHLHNCKSMYDKRSSTLDVETGAPTDIKYE